MPTVNEMLAALNIDELAPLEAITKLYELKRAAAAETRAEPDETTKQLNAVMDILRIIMLKCYDMNNDELDDLDSWLRQFGRFVDSMKTSVSAHRAR